MKRLGSKELYPVSAVQSFFYLRRGTVVQRLAGARSWWWLGDRSFGRLSRFRIEYLNAGGAHDEPSQHALRQLRRPSG